MNITKGQNTGSQYIIIAFILFAVTVTLLLKLYKPYKKET